MTLPLIRGALLWCFVLNIGVLMFWFACLTLAHDWAYRMHSKWFKLSPEGFDAIHYAGMAFFKVAITVFNLVPWVALHIVG